jgi:hypothetical protein
MYDQIRPNPTEEEIRARSYAIWEREGRPNGKAEEHWQRASAQLELESVEKHIASIHFREQPFPSEEDIRTRSHEIWEQEGRPKGKAEIHWLKAKKELEEEFLAECAAYVDGKSTTFVIPLLQIPSPPTFSDSIEVDLTVEPEEPVRVSS